MNYVVLALVLVLIGGGAGGVWFYTDAIKRAEKAETAAANWQATAEASQDIIAEQKVEKKRRDDAAAKRTKQQIAQDAKSRGQDEAAAKAERDDPTVRFWRDERVPQSLVDSMRNDGRGANPAKEGPVPAPGKPAAGKTSP